MKNNNQFQGVFGAVATPYDKKGFVDLDALGRYFSWVKTQNIDGVVPCGTTGEFLVLSREEKKEIIALACTSILPNQRVIAGAAAVTVRETVANILDAQEAGAHAVLLVTPHYVSSTDISMRIYYEEIHNATDIPIVIYVNPKRTMRIISTSTLRYLAALPRIVGLKDSSLDFAQNIALSTCENFSLLCGDDATFLPFLASGGQGIISVCGSVFPKYYKAILSLWREKETSKALELSHKLSPMHELFRSAKNLLMIKYINELRGFGHHENNRLTSEPLSPIEKEMLLDIFHEAEKFENF